MSTVHDPAPLVDYTPPRANSHERRSSGTSTPKSSSTPPSPRDIYSQAQHDIRKLAVSLTFSTNQPKVRVYPKLQIHKYLTKERVRQLLQLPNSEPPKFVQEVKPETSISRICDRYALVLAALLLIGHHRLIFRFLDKRYNDETIARRPLSAHQLRQLVDFQDRSGSADFVQRFGDLQSSFFLPYIRYDAGHKSPEARLALPFDIVEKPIIDTRNFMVYAGKILPMYHNFPDVKDNAVAVQVYRDKTAALEDFLKQRTKYMHPFIMPIQASLDHRGEYIAIYPLADATLEELLQQDPPNLFVENSEAPWFQFVNVLSALEHIYKSHSQEAKYYLDINPGKMYILNNKWMINAPGGHEIPEQDQYLAPENYPHRGYDVWSLGCIGLQIIVWLSRGLKGLKEFHKSRESMIGGELRYRFQQGGELHPAVKQLLAELKWDAEEDSLQFGILEILEEMLCIEEAERPTARESERRFRKLLGVQSPGNGERSNTSMNYWTESLGVIADGKSGRFDREKSRARGVLRGRSHSRSGSESRSRSPGRGRGGGRGRSGSVGEHIPAGLDIHVGTPLSVPAEGSLGGFALERACSDPGLECQAPGTPGVSAPQHRLGAKKGASPPGGFRFIVTPPDQPESGESPIEEVSRPGVGIADRLKGWVEDFFDRPLIWWPLNERQPPTQPGDKAYVWKCEKCKKNIPYLVSNWEATARTIPPPSYETAVEREPDPNTGPRRTVSSSSTDSTGPDTPSSPELSFSRYIPRDSPIREYPYADRRRKDYVILCVTEKPGRVIFGSVVLPPRSERSDERFFRDLKEKYNELRGLRRWFSLTEFSGFRYVMLHVYHLNYVNCEPHELLSFTHPQYYFERPPLSTFALRHLFEDPCGLDSHGSDNLRRIITRINGDPDAIDPTSYGIEALEAVAVWKVVVVAVGVLSGTMTYVETWRRVNGGGYGDAFLWPFFMLLLAWVTIHFLQLQREA